MTPLHDDGTSTGHSPARAAGGRRLVLVVGPYRSGTSLFASILAQLGFRVPQPEVQADDSNPRGFGEPRWVVDFHKRVLRNRRVTVMDSRPAAWQIMTEAAGDSGLVKELTSWIAVQFVGADDVVVKDPRIGWFLPLWVRCAGDLGVSTRFVTMLRYPPEVASSARTWYGAWQSDASRVAAWTNVALHTEHATRGGRRAFVRYDDLLADWPREVARCARLLDLPWLLDVDRSRYPSVEALVDPALRRQAVGWDDLRVPESLRTLTDDVWRGVSALTEPGGDNAATHESLDALRAAYVAFYSEAEAVAQSSVTAAKARRKPEGTPRAAGRRDADAIPASLPVRIIRRIPRRYRERVPPHVRRQLLQAGRSVVHALRR